MANPYDAPDFRQGGLVVSGDVEIDAFSSVARLTGIAPGTFAPGGFPAGVFFGNVLDIAAAGTTWSWSSFAGTGLAYVNDVTNPIAPFPSVVDEYNDAAAAAATSHDIVMPTLRQARDRIIVEMRTTALDTGASALDLSTLPDWARMDGESTAVDGIGAVDVIEIILDEDLSNDPGTSITVDLTVSAALTAHVWLVRGSHPTLPGACRAAFSTTSVANRDVGLLLAPWREANSLWGCFVGNNNNLSTITVFPDDFDTGQGQLSVAISSHNHTIGYGSRQLRADSLDATTWTFSTSPRSVAIHWVVAPREAGQLRLSASSSVPAEVFIANLFDYAAPARAWSISDFAGTGLSITSAVGNGPFPEPVELAGANTLGDLALTVSTVVMPAVAAGQAALLVISAGGTADITSVTDAGVSPRNWQFLGAGVGSSHRAEVWYITPEDMTEEQSEKTEPILITSASAQALITRIVAINDAHPTQLPTLSAFSLQNGTTSTTTNDIGSVTPVPGDGSAEANYLYLAFLSTATEDSIVSAYPTDYVDTDGVAGGDQVFVASGTGTIDNSLAYCQRQIRGSSENIGVWTYAASGNGRSIGVNIAIIPASVARQDWDGVGVRLNGSLIGTRRNINSLSTTSIIATATDDAANDEVELGHERAALTGAVTAAQNSNTTAFGTAAAKSVLANATNAVAVPAFLAGSAAFQHLRVNSANTALEWSLLTAGDFPAGIVPLTAIAAQAANTIVANATNGVASPTAFPISTNNFVLRLAGDIISGTGTQATTLLDVFTSGLKGLVPASGGGTTNFLRADGTFAPTTGLIIRDNGVDETTQPALNFVSTASVILAGTQDVPNTEVEITAQRAALTGAITAALNDNTTAFGSAAAKSVLANATNGAAVPAYLAGSAAFQHLRVNSANTALEWSVLTTGDFPANSVPLTALATIATDTLIANITAGTATPVAVAFSGIDSTSIIWDATAHEFQRAALTGAVTAAQNSNTTAFGSAAAKSVLANATNGAAVPAFLAGAATYQHLRVNLANNALEWATLSTFASTSIAYASDTFMRAALSGAISAATNTNTTLFAGIRTNGSATADRTNLNFLNSAGGSITMSVVDDSGNDELEITATRAALTGAITASADSNTTAFGALAAKSVLANATNASAVPAALAGTAAFQHLRVNSANTALEWSVLQAGDFPAATVPLASIATQAANTVVANATSSVASPTAFAVGTNTVLGRVAGDIVAAQLVNAQVTNNTLALNKLVTVARHTVVGNTSESTTSAAAIDQPGLARIMHTPDNSGSCVVCWEDEDFKQAITGPGGASVTVTVAGHHDIFNFTTGHNGKWFATAGANTGIFQWQVSDPVGHNGIIMIQTGAVSGDAIAFYHGRDSIGGGNGEPNFPFDDFEGVDFYVMMPTVTSINIRIGVGDNITATGFGADSAYFELNAPTDTTMHVVTRTASTSTDTDVGFTPGAGQWLKLSIYVNSLGDYEFYINNSLEATHTTNLPTNNGLAGIRISTNTAATRAVHVDRVRIFMDDRAMFD